MVDEIELESINPDSKKRILDYIGRVPYDIWCYMEYTLNEGEMEIRIKNFKLSRIR